MSTEIYARQGDLVIHKLDAPPTGTLEPRKNFVFAGDSSGHPHMLRGLSHVMQRGRTTIVRIDEPMALEHGKAGGHRTVDLEIGHYEVRPLRERGDGSDRAVDD
jgi:hypothetical protein